MNKIYLILFVILYSCNTENDKPFTEAEYEIYSTTLDSVLTNDLESSVVVVDSTLRDDYWYFNSGFFSRYSAKKRFNKSLNHVSKFWKQFDHESILDDFIPKSLKRYKIDSTRIKTVRPINLVSEEVLKNLAKIDSSRLHWHHFYHHYPNSIGLVHLSRVAFNGNRNQAYVYVKWGFDSLGAENYILLFLKENDSWSIVEKIVLTVT